MNYFNWYKKGLIYILLGFNFSSCLPWDLPDECTEGLPSLSVSTGTTINATVGGSSASWSLVNSSGSVVLSSSGTNLSFNPTSLASGNYTIKAVGRNSCGFTFDVSQVYVKSQPLIDMVNITGGTFQMGDIRDEGYADEKPIRLVVLSNFRIGKYEVSYDQWRTVMGGTASGATPEENVDWYDAVKFCTSLSDREGRQRVYEINGSEVNAIWNANGYRLPTEAEWEYAAGGGETNRTRFGNGRNILNPAEANFDASSFYKEDYSNVGSGGWMTVEIGSFIPNQLGLYDMTGNVEEWCWDWWDSYPNVSPDINPKGAFSGTERIVRGGSTSRSPKQSRVPFRGKWDPTTDGLRSVGFRVATNF